MHIAVICCTAVLLFHLKYAFVMKGSARMANPVLSVEGHSFLKHTYLNNCQLGLKGGGRGEGIANYK